MNKSSDTTKIAMILFLAAFFSSVVLSWTVVLAGKIPLWHVLYLIPSMFLVKSVILFLHLRKTNV